MNLNHHNHCKNNILNLSSYLGKKGYTLYKKDFSPEELQNIRNELTIQPQTSGRTTIEKPIPIKAYRECSAKMYIPYFYAEKRFGLQQQLQPIQSDISPGHDINLSFQGTLMGAQPTVVDTFLKKVFHIPTIKSGGLLELPCGFGKTALSLFLIAEMKKKTLVIVHKEFLMNQWIERIEQFLPGARVGKIQGPTIDIEGKDIVIGMLQSLSMKEYSADIFESFGFLVVDEVHHISSEVFSKSLFKIVTKYTLGLSATMNRKDGTTRLFKMFLGDVLFKGAREETFNVEVRAIDYYVDDHSFNRTEVDYRGNVMYSTMISKLCEYSHRSEFILTVLKNLIEEDDEQQIMILAHNKNLLTYLHNAIEHRGIAKSVGYYVGGMKEKDLKESEKKQVVIATYAMAAEALDIKTLTTLIMATPKSDIQQSVGRILREKHEKHIVVDILDSHACFKGQWAKRKAFYNKEKYKIIRSSSSSSSKSKTISTPIPTNIELDLDIPSGKCLIDFKKWKKED
jgi:superfamily II DNA or RNA helicase